MQVVKNDEIVPKDRREIMVRAAILGVFLLLVQVLADSDISLSAGSIEKTGRPTAYEFYLSGNLSFRDGNYQEAISAFRRAIELDPGYGYAHANLGVSLAKTQDFDGAIEEFTFCIDRQFGSGADRFVFHFNRALARKEDKQTETAQRDWAALQKLDPERTRALGSSGVYILMDTAYIEKRNELARDRLLKEFETSITRGKVVVRKVPGAGKNTEEYEALGLIEGTLEEVSGILADYGRYREFMPNVKETIVTDLPGGEVVVDWQLKLPMGVIKKYRLKCWAKEEDHRVQRFWRKLPWPGLKSKETIVDTYGQWILEEFPGADNRVLAYYRVYTDPGHIPFGTGWIVDILTERSVPDIIKRTRKRVEEIFR